MRKQRVQFYSLLGTSDGAGGTIPGEALYWDTRAEVTPLKNSRTLEGNQMALDQGFTFKVAYRSDKTVEQSMILKYNSRTLTISSVEDVKEYRKFLFIVAMDRNEG